MRVTTFAHFVLFFVAVDQLSTQGVLVNKAQLVAAVVADTSDKVTDAVAAEAVDAVFSAIVRAVAKGDDVTVTGFGVFEKRRRAARTARNPRTGEKVRVRATNVPVFRPSESFKDATAKRIKLPKTGSVIKRASSVAVEAKPAAKKTATKKVAAKKVVAKKSPAKKVTAAKAPATKVAPKPAKKAAVKKAAAKKVAAKKK